MYVKVDRWECEVTCELHKGDEPVATTQELAKPSAHVSRARRQWFLLSLGSVSVIATVAFFMVGDADEPTWQPTFQADGNAPAKELDCTIEQQQAIDLEVRGPGQATPEAAVTNLEPTVRVDRVERNSDQNSASVYVADGTGRIVSIYAVELLTDGWWPQSQRTC